MLYGQILCEVPNSSQDPQDSGALRDDAPPRPEPESLNLKRTGGGFFVAGRQHPSCGCSESSPGLAFGTYMNPKGLPAINHPPGIGKLGLEASCEF